MKNTKRYRIEGAYQTGFTLGLRGEQSSVQFALQHGFVGEQVVEFLNGVEDGRSSRNYASLHAKGVR